MARGLVGRPAGASGPGLAVAPSPQEHQDPELRLPASSVSCVHAHLGPTKNRRIQLRTPGTTLENGKLRSAGQNRVLLQSLDCPHRLSKLIDYCFRAGKQRV